MADLQKTIKGLECCSLEPERLKDCRYRGCPYSDLEGKGEFENFDCVAALSRDALSLLKAQEPRIMTVEEAAKNAYSYFHTPDSVKPVFVQFRDKTYSDEAMTPPWRGGVNQRALLKEPDRYGKDFVFWTDRPSPEQMKVVEWDGI